MLKHARKTMIAPRLAGLSAALAATFLLAACGSVGPDFVAPAFDAGAPAYRHAGAIAGASEKVAALPHQWWSVYRDSTLDALEAAAQANSPSVQASAARLLQAQAQLGVTSASRLPQLSVGTSVANTRSSSATSQGIALGGTSITGNQYEAGLSLSYEVDLWGKVRRAVEAADAQALVSQYDRDGVLLLLSSQVATTYWQLRGLDAELAILNAALATRHETQELVEARFAGGFGNELDVSRAHLETANAEADMHEVRRQRLQLEHALATLTGASPSSFTLAALAPDAGALPEPPAIPVGLPAALLSQRPDLAASVATLRAQNAQVGIATAAFYPSISLTTSYGYASESLSRLLEGGSRQFSYGPLGFSLPIFDGGRNRNNLALAKARYDEAAANHQSKLLTALREVEDSLSDTRQRAEQGKAQALAQQAALRALQVARKRYELGVSNYLDVTDAQRSSLVADRSAVQIRTQRLLASAAVARALGGGWQADTGLAALDAKTAH